VAWTVEVAPQAARTLASLDRPTQVRIQRYMAERLATEADPRRLGHSLSGPLAGLWRYRVGDCRLICRVEDVIHHFLHGRIRLGVCVYDELFYGMNADLRTIGAYYVSGVLTIPTSCAEADWEFDPKGPARAGRLLIEPDYPPDIEEASYIAEDSVPPAFWGWAPERHWDNPETDHSRFEGFGVGFTGIDESGNPIFDWRAIDPARLVIHAVERERLLRVDKADSLGDQAVIQPQEAPPLSIAPGSGDPDTTGMVAWQATVIESWTLITAKYGPRPSARRVLAWLRESGPPDVFPPKGNRHTGIRRSGSILAEIHRY
jgi:mRNA interferase RelE/StbE